MLDPRDRRIFAAFRALLGGLAWLLAASVSGSCERSHTQDGLIVVEGVEAVPDSPEQLFVLGEGFPAGVTGELALEGSVYVPGQPLTRFAASLACRAISDARVHVALQAARLPKHPAGLFEGRITLRFDTPAGRARIVGSLARLTLRLPGTRPPDVASEVAMARRARTFQHALGVLEVEAGDRGVIIGRLRPDSPAVRAGLREGDLVTRMDDTPVELPAELLPLPGSRAPQLEVVRASEILRLRVPLDEPGGRRGLTWLCLLVFAAAGALLPGLAVRGAIPGRLRELAWLGALAVLTCALSALATGELDLRTVWCVPFGLRLAFVAAQYVRRRLDAVALSREAFELCAATLSVLTLGLVLGQLRDPFFGLGERALPWQWPLANAPAAWLATFGLAQSWIDRETSGDRIERLTRRWQRSAQLCALVVLGLGGGRLPVELGLDADGRGLWLLGTAVLSLKLLAVWAWLESVSRTRASDLARAVSALLAPVLAWWWARMALDAALIDALGAAVVGLTLARLTRTVVARVRRSPSADPSLAPFL